MRVDVPTYKANAAFCLGRAGSKALVLHAFHMAPALAALQVDSVQEIGDATGGEVTVQHLGAQFNANLEALA